MDSGYSGYDCSQNGSVARSRRAVSPKLKIQLNIESAASKTAAKSQFELT